VSPPELLAVLRRIESRGAIETAHRALQNCGQIFRYAIATSRGDRDISVNLRGALAPKVEKHFASVKEPAAVGALMRAIESYHGSFVTKCALQMAALTFVRPYAKTVEDFETLLPWNVKTALAQDSSTYRTELVR